MGRRFRIEFPGAVYHVYARGNSKDSVFLDDADRRRFLGYLRRAAARHGLVYHAYCLMGNHFHLLLETPEGNLSGGMHWIDSSYAGYFNRVHGHVGHVFQGRFEAILVDREAYLQELCRYIVLNPVRAFMVEDPALYPWSSFRETAGIDRRTGGVVSPNWILSRFGEEGREAEGADRTPGEPLRGARPPARRPPSEPFGAVLRRRSTPADRARRPGAVRLLGLALQPLGGRPVPARLPFGHQSHRDEMRPGLVLCKTHRTRPGLKSGRGQRRLSAKSFA